MPNASKCSSAPNRSALLKVAALAAVAKVAVGQAPTITGIRDFYFTSSEF